ncbi:MAG: hypothetical protein Q8N99_05295 [Nanoarchaeota archaeon]|nr:hypothetical protein [Nanoarchaeota archaeon]
MNNKRILGISLVFIGLFMVFTSKGITGAFIGFKPQNYLGLLGLLVIIIGFFLILVSREGGLEKGLRVYDKYDGKGKHSPSQAYSITDPERYFSTVGFLTLEEFNRGLSEIKDDSELVELVRLEYGPELKMILDNPSDKNEARIAEAFYHALYDRRYEKHEKPNELSDSEKEAIMIAFRAGWKNSPDSRQSKILARYRLGYRVKGKHGEIYSRDDEKLKTTTSITPSDANAGKNIGGNVIELIRKTKR